MTTVLEGLRPFDPGLQPERTELAWRRTALAMGLLGLFAAVALCVGSRRRMQQVNIVLARDGDRGRMPGAGPLAALALFVLATGALATVVVLTAIERTGLSAA